MSSFELSEEKYIAMLRRLKVLEEAFNNIAVAIDNLASTQQVQELLVIIQADLRAFEEKLTAIDNRVTTIEHEPLN